MKRLSLVLILCFIAASSFGSIIDKNGAEFPTKPATAQAGQSSRDDWVYNTGGVEDFVPTLQGSADGWGEWFITTVMNDSGDDLYLSELGFPCSGPATGEYGWVIWLDMGGIVAPAGDVTTAHYFGAFSPVEPDPLVDPRVYTSIDISDLNIVVPNGVAFCFGYDNTGLGGQTEANGVESWAWYGGLWDPDSAWGRTAILQVKANFDDPVSTQDVSFDQIKSLFR